MTCDNFIDSVSFFFFPIIKKMNPSLHLPSILVSFESSLRSQIRENKELIKCPALRVSKEIIDNLNLFMNRFIKQVMSSALLIIQNKKRKTITEVDLNLVFHTMLDPYGYKWSDEQPAWCRAYYKENFLDHPNPKKQATLKDKYDPDFFRQMNPYQVEKAMRLLLPHGYRISEMAIVLMTMTMFKTFDSPLFTCMNRFCKLLKDKTYKGPRILTYDRLKDTFKTEYDFEVKYPTIKFYAIENVCKLLP